MYVRAVDTIYLYGGDDGLTYDSCEVIAELPFISGDKPGSFKSVNGVDIIAVGDWAVTGVVDPRNETRIADYGTLSGVTVGDGMSAGNVMTAFVAPRLRHMAPGPATVSQVLVYYEPAADMA